MFHIYVHIDNFHLLLTLNLILSLGNNWVHSFHWPFPSSPPTLFLDGFALHICPIHQWIVSRCAGGFVVSDCFVCAECSFAVYLVSERFCWSAGFVFDVCHPSLLLHFCKWDSLVPICITLVLVLLYWRFAGLVPMVQS